MRQLLFPILIALLAGCDNLPRDPEGSLQRIRQERHFTIGFSGASPEEPMTRRLLAQVERQAGARAVVRQGEGEALLHALSEGQIDLVIGRFTKDSPWQTDIAFAPPLARTTVGGEEIDYKAAVRDGENRWLMLVERASRAASQENRP